tara:strand:- start:33 stop:227 length:195 start_codon:yes stop_codon:yes gene_type:complete
MPHRVRIAVRACVPLRAGKTEPFYASHFDGMPIAVPQQGAAALSTSAVVYGTTNEGKLQYHSTE